MMVRTVTGVSNLECLLVTVHVKARHVTVKGKRGEVKKNFQHLAVELQKIKQNDNKRKGNYIRIRMWFGGYKQACAVNTLKSLIENMITGVTEVSTTSVSPLSFCACVCDYCFSLRFDLINYYTMVRATDTR